MVSDLVVPSEQLFTCQMSFVLLSSMHWMDDDGDDNYNRKKQQIGTQWTTEDFTVD